LLESYIDSFMITEKAVVCQDSMARRLDPKFSEKNFVSEKLISIRKNYFASEKTLIYFFSILLSISSGRCTDPFDLVCVNIFLTDYQLLRNEERWDIRFSNPISQSTA